MTENLAGRGEGLKGLAAKWRQRAECGGASSEIKNLFRRGQVSAQTECAMELETALEAAAPAGTAGICPICYHPNAALATPSPQAPPEQESAFSTTSAREQSSATASANLRAAELAIKHCREQINVLDKLEGVTEYEKGDFAGQIDAYAQVGEILHDLIHAKSAPAATQEPAGSGAKLANGFNMLRIAEEITRGVSSMSKHATATGISMWVRSVLEREFGSPRKVGEDGAFRMGVLLGEKIWQLRERGKELAKNPQEYFRGLADGFESLANELEALARSSSVPVGEQKQEEGV